MQFSSLKQDARQTFLQVLQISTFALTFSVTTLGDALE